MVDDDTHRNNDGPGDYDKLYNEDNPLETHYSNVAVLAWYIYYCSG
jgi:hypothetical protein